MEENLAYTYSEKAIEKSIREADGSRQIRNEQAFLNATGEGLREGMVPYFANLWLGKDLQETNKILLDILTTEDAGIQENYRLNCFDVSFSERAVIRTGTYKNTLKYN